MSDDEYTENSPGWDAIDAALAPIYGDQQPKHYGTVIPWMLGGNDPLQGISAFEREGPVRHWHFVTYGFSELYDKEDNSDPDVSGYGFEMTFRLAVDEFEEAPPAWPMNFLQNLGRYVFTTGNVFAPGHHMNLNGPICLESDTAIQAMAIALDPELPGRKTENGSLDFLQVVGITLDEMEAIESWQGEAFVELLQQHLPLLTTDIERSSLFSDDSFAKSVEQGIDRDGSSTSFLYVGKSGWTNDNDGSVSWTVGANAMRPLQKILPLRLKHGQSLELVADGMSVMVSAADETGFDVDEECLLINLAEADQGAFLDAMKPVAGEPALDFLSGLHVTIEKTEITDRDGNVVETVG